MKIVILELSFLKQTVSHFISTATGSIDACICRVKSMQLMSTPLISCNLILSKKITDGIFFLHFVDDATLFLFLQLSLSHKIMISCRHSQVFLS